MVNAESLGMMMSLGSRKAPEATANAVDMGVEIFGDLMAEQEVHRPGEQQVVNSRHQAQSVLMAELWSLQAEVNVGAALVTSNGTRAEQPNRLHLGASGQPLE